MFKIYKMLKSILYKKCLQYYFYLKMISNSLFEMWWKLCVGNANDMEKRQKVQNSVVRVGRQMKYICESVCKVCFELKKHCFVSCWY